MTRSQNVSASTAPRFGQHIAVRHLVAAIGGQHRPAASALGLGARNTQHVEIVLGGADPHFGQRLDQLADAVDLAVALARSAEHDTRRLVFPDPRRWQRQLHHVEHQPRRVDALDMPRQHVARPLISVALGVDADVLHPQLRQLPQVAIPDLGKLVAA